MSVPAPEAIRVREAVSFLGSPAATPDSVEALKRFRVIFRSVRHHFHEVEQRCGVSGSQLWALSVVVRTPGIRVKDLAQAMAIQQSTASNLVEQLSRQELIRRERDRFDQRIVLLHPTDPGRAVIEKAPQPLTGLLPDALARLEPARLRMLNELLQEVVQRLHHSEAEAEHTPLADM